MHNNLEKCGLIFIVSDFVSYWGSLIFIFLELKSNFFLKIGLALRAQ